MSENERTTIDLLVSIRGYLIAIMLGTACVFIALLFIARAAGAILEKLK